MKRIPTPSSFAVPDFLHRTLVLIPALNEEESLPATIASWRSLGVAGVRVVDNGSGDRTEAVARAEGAEVISEPQRGYGAAVRRGLENWPASADWVLFSSADGSDRLTLEEALCWQRAIDEGANLVVGDRTSRRSGPSELSLVQLLGNRFICLALRFGWGGRFNDMGSLRLVRHCTLLALGLEDRGFGWNVEMQIRALQQGLKVVELPVTYRPREAGRSKISGTLSGTLRAGWGMLRILWRMWGLRREGGGTAAALSQPPVRKPRSSR